MKFLRVESMTLQEAEKAIGTPNRKEYDQTKSKPDENMGYKKIIFENKADLIDVAHNILFEKKLLIGQKKLHLILHK